MQRTVASHVRRGLSSDLANSVETFRILQAERESDLGRLAELMADLPSLKALMTSHHGPTIQDGSRELFPLAGSDLLALVDPTGKLMGFHTKAPGISREQAQQLLDARGASVQSVQWWSAAGHLYEVMFAPIYFGPSSQNAVLGMVGVGYEMNTALARQVGQIAASQVAIVCDARLVASTLNPEQGHALASYVATRSIPAGPTNWKLGPETFMVSSLALNPDATPPVTMIVLKSYDEATAFLDQLRQLLLAVGLGAVLGGTALVYFIAGTFTRPLEHLVDGVRALGGGDYRYPVHPAPGGEVAELTDAFTRMRESLRQAQQRLLHTERLATIGRMASSISHDLRHPLTAVLANAEFLADADLTPEQREELYLEIRVAVSRLTDLVDSLLELSRPAESLTLVEGPVERSINRAIELVRAHREFQSVAVSIQSAGTHEAQYDPRKMERAFYNLLLNGCQAAQVSGGHVGVEVAEQNGDLTIRITDDGPGVESSIRDKLFQPFVSYGKQNGTGLGLTIAQKIVQDHHGTLLLESSAPGRTVMCIAMPRTIENAPAEAQAAKTSASFTS